MNTDPKWTVCKTHVNDKVGSWQTGDYFYVQTHDTDGDIASACMTKDEMLDFICQLEDLVGLTNCEVPL